MSLLFDTPGPRARARHRMYAVALLLLLAVLGFVVARRLYDEEVLTLTVFNDTFQNDNVSYLLEGLVATLKAAGAAIVCSLVFGTVLAVGRLSDHRLLRWPATVVIEFFRAVPLVLQIILIYSAFQDALGVFGSLVAGLTLYNGSVLAEVFRAGVVAVPRGQSEAAYSVGMRKTQVMALVLLPQAVKFMLPAIISQCVIVLKDTSLGYVIVYVELVRTSRQVALAVQDATILTYVTAALVFIAINYSLSKLAEYLERRLARSGQQPLNGGGMESGVVGVPA